MQIDKIKIIKNASLIVLALIVILLLILGIKSSKFGKIKKYDIEDESPREMMSHYRHPSNKSNGMQVTIRSNTEANLGDFTFNISGDRKLVANISLKYKPNREDDSWFNNKDSIKKEILKKSVILRDAAINTMLGHSANVDSEQMRKALKNTLNKNLSSGKIEEVYFNQFIIQ